MEMVGYGADIVNTGEFEGAEEFDPFVEYTEENIEIKPDSPPETQWYHGRLDRAMAEKRLKEVGSPGSYLIRESDGKPGVYVLSFLNYNLIDHFKITAMCGEYYIGGREFNSLSVLIGYYTGWSDLLKNKRLIHPVPPPEPVLDRKLVKSIVRYMKIPDTDELSFVEGEVFIVHNDMGDGWFWVTSTLTKKSGIINQELVQELKDTDDPVKQYPWFHACISKEEIATKLNKTGAGSWLVRKSETTHGDFTLHFFCKSQIHKFKVQRRSAGLYFMGGRNYKSVAEVIERYKSENLVDGFHLETPFLRDPPDTSPPTSDLLDREGSKVKHSNGSNFFLNRKDSIVIDGHLNKKSQKTKKWKRMFFILNKTEQILFYFDNERRSKPKGLINLIDTSLYPVHDSLFERPNVFLLVSKELNQTSLYYLCSDTTDIAQEWTQKLRAHCTLPQLPQHNNDHKKPRPSESLTELRSVNIKIHDLKFSSSKHSYSHPYCIVSLNDAKVCRTQSAKCEHKCWDEDFLIDDIPSDVDYFVISIYNREKLSKDKELSRVVVMVDNLRTDVEEDKWHSMTPSLKTEACQLRVSLRFQHEVIMPVEHYLPLSQLLLDKKMELVVLLEGLCSKSNQDRTRLASALLNLFRHENQEIALIKKFLEREIEQEVNKEELFRHNNFGASLMDQYMKMVASSFLQQAIQKTICNSLKISQEVSDITEEETNLLTKSLFSELLQDILLLSDAIPPVLRHIFYCLRKKVSQKWPFQKSEFRVISAFIFLRLICPALLRPRLFIPITTPVSCLILKNVAKWMTTLTNLREFKVDSLKCYNEFLHEQEPSILKFLDQVSGDSVEPPSFGASSVDMSRCLATIHQLCMSNRDAIKRNESQPITGKLLAVTDILSSKEKYMKANKNTS